MAAEMTPQLWYELERLETTSYQIGTMQLSTETHGRIACLKTLVTMGYAHWTPHTNGRHGYFKITDTGCDALRAHRRANPSSSPEITVER